ncbi:MAG: AbrB/MazE/SpoVT family DNA-binding domain-containing protein [Proteobacteria bacterium]|nr:AbrB/MazE/SpoVT family DNA-binding domain-containing protein [Pseudomonadota bacterium]
MPTVMKISPQGQIRIPKKVLAALKIVPGDYIEVDVERGQAVLKPRKLIDPSQELYWDKEWQKTKNEVDDEIANEKLSPTFHTAEEGLKWLKE